METIDRINEELKALYQQNTTPIIASPPGMQAVEFVQLASEYMSAASLLAKEDIRLILPRLQLTGLAIECSLKACLAVVETPPYKHDLVELYKLATRNGYQLDDRQCAMIVHLNHVYYQDLGTGTKFKSRYRTKSSEHLGGVLPSTATYVAIIGSLIKQITQRVDPPFQEMIAALPADIIWTN